MTDLIQTENKTIDKITKLTEDISVVLSTDILKMSSKEIASLCEKELYKIWES